MARIGRRPGSNNTREQILEAARDQFGEKGYGNATIRGIAARAGVNAALVHHYFGSKEQVFAATMALPFDPEQVVNYVIEGPRESIGERFLGLYLTLWREPETRAPFLALIRSVATSEHAAGLMSEFMDHAVFRRVSERLGVPRLRINAVMTQILGLALGRYVIGIEPLAHAEEEEIIELMAPVIQHYFDGPS